MDKKEGCGVLGWKRLCWLELRTGRCWSGDVSCMAVDKLEKVVVVLSEYGG